MIYQLPASDFHDITTGTSTGTPNYSAGPGYDEVTGIGVPLVAGLLAALTPAPPAITGQPQNATIVDGATATFHVAANAPTAPAYRWQLSTNGGATWTALVDGGIYSGTATATLTLTDPAPSLNGAEFGL